MKTLYTCIIMLFMGLTMNSQTLLSQSTEQFDNLIVTTKTFNDGSINYHLRAAQGVPTDLTTFLNLPCNATTCATITLGCCFGDGWDHPEDTECMFPDYQVYYVTENTFIEYELTVLRKARLEARNGSSIININNEFVYSTACDVPEDDQVTGLVFLGAVPGQLFGSLADFQQTLSTTTEKLTSKNVYNQVGKTYYLYDVIGQMVYSGPITTNTKTDLKQFSGMYFMRVGGFNNVVKIVNK